MVSWSEMPRSPGHVFYDRLQSVLIEGGFDAFAEASCRPYYAARMGAPSVPPGRYFRMHLVGYFEGIDSERGLEWRCSDSLSLRAFLRLGSRDRVPDHSWLSRSRTRLPHEVHAAVFDWVLVLIAEAGLIKGERIGVDASTMEANAALRNIVRRDNGEGYREMLERLARESGVETPTAEDLARLERKRKGKKLSNTDWVSKSDPEAKIAKMKDGTTHLAYKPEHAVDLDTGAVVAAELHPADEGDTTTLSKTLAKAEANLEAVDAAPTSEDPAECVADKGYHSRAVLRALNDSPWKTRIAAPKQTGFSRWHGDEAARRAVTNNRARLKSGVAREAFKLRAEIVERCFAHNLDRGGMRRTWLRGRENVRGYRPGSNFEQTFTGAKQRKKQHHPDQYSLSIALLSNTPVRRSLFRPHPGSCRHSVPHLIHRNPTLFASVVRYGHILSSEQTSLAWFGSSKQATPINVVVPKLPRLPLPSADALFCRKLGNLPVVALRAPVRQEHARTIIEPYRPEERPFVIAQGYQVP